MPYRCSALVLVLTLAILAPARSVAASSNTDRALAKRASHEARVRDGIRQLGTGPDARVSLRTYDGERLSGYIATADDTMFVVATSSGHVTQVPYGDVSQVKGHNLATGWKIAIGVGIGVGVVVLVWVLLILAKG